MSQRPWSRDPRDAGRGNFSQATHHMPVTLFLMFVSIGVALLTQFGAHMEKAESLYLRSPNRLEEYNRQVDEYETLRNGILTGQASGARAPSEQIQKLEQANAHLKELKTALHDPLSDIKKGQVWRLVTPIFLHFDVLHILFNMMWTWQLGMLLEIRFRSMRFLGLVLLVAVVSNVAQGLWGGSHFGPNIGFGGMSGVVYGLFGFVLLRSKLHPSPEFAMSRQTIVGMLVWMVLCFTGRFGPIANVCHVAGLLIGAAAGTANALLAGGWKTLKRREQFRSAVSSSATTFHRCAACGKTELDDPSLEFYVSEKDHQEYCRDHLP